MFCTLPLRQVQTSATATQIETFALQQEGLSIQVSYDLEAIQEAWEQLQPKDNIF